VKFVVIKSEGFIGLSERENVGKGGNCVRRGGNSL